MSERKNLLQRLNSIQQDVRYIQKEIAPGLKYSITTHDMVTAKVRPAMVEHGVIYYPMNINSSQNGNRTEVAMIVRFASIDDKNDYIDVHTLGYGVDSQDKGPGKAISYAIKMALLKTLGLETGDDPDETQDARADYTPAPAPAPAASNGKDKTLPTDPQDWLKLESEINVDIANSTDEDQLRKLWAWYSEPLAVMKQRYSLQYATVRERFVSRRKEITDAPSAV